MVNLGVPSRFVEFFSRAEEYRPLSDGNSEQFEEYKRTSRSIRPKLCTYFVAVLSMAFSFMLGVVIMYYSAPNTEACSNSSSGSTSHSHNHEMSMTMAAAAAEQQQEVYENHCGETLEEAKANGCQFDWLSGLWLPQACSRSYEQEFLEMPGTGYYTAPGADLADGIGRNVTDLPFGTPYYTTRLHHVTHCLFLWLRNNDKREGIPVAWNAMGLRHQSHCAQMILGMQGKGTKALWEVAVRGDIYRQSC